MQVTAITHFKQGAIYQMLRELNWTQQELADRAGISATKVGEIVNLKRRPSQAQADAIQRAFGAQGRFLDVLKEWPEGFTGFEQRPVVEQTQEVPMERLLDCREAFLLEAPQPDNTEELDQALEDAMSELTDNEQAVLKARFWGLKTMDEVGKELGLSHSRVGQIQQKALRRLRNPLRMKKLEPHLPPDFRTH